jgi:hypothetical protein
VPATGVTAAAETDPIAGGRLGSTWSGSRTSALRFWLVSTACAHTE